VGFRIATETDFLFLQTVRPMPFALANSRFV
jgi:hypothetical protein